MKPRSKPLIIPSPLPNRYWTVDVRDRGLHVFRHPYYGVAGAIAQALASLAEEGEGQEKKSLHDQAIATLPAAGMFIGACWHHPLYELETQLQLNDLSPESLVAYGNAVCDELQESDYDLLDLVELFGKLAPEVGKRQSVMEMAVARAGFSAPPEGASTH